MGWILIAAIIPLLLLPTLFLPLGPDQAIFMVVGEGVLKGGVLYRDLIDIKPPLIFYLYGSAAALFGSNSAVSIRIVDVVLQCLSCLMLIKLVRRASGNDLTALLAALCYLTAYLAIGYLSLAQTESYIALFGGAAFWLLLFRRRPSGFLLTGVLIAILFLFKFTLGVLLPVVLVGEMTLFNQEPRKWLRNVLLITAGFVGVVAAVTLYEQATGSLGPFIEMQTFVSGYAKREWASLAQWLKNACTLVPYNLAINFSVIYSAAAVLGIVISTRSLHDAPPEERDSIRLMRLSTAAFFLLIVSVMIEAKYMAWHVTRFYPFGAILAAFGFVVALRWFAREKRFPRSSIYANALLLLFVGAVLFYTPLSGYFWRTATLGLKYMRWEMRSPTLTDPPPVQDDFLEEARGIASYVVPRRKPREKMMVVSSIGGLIYHTCGVAPEYPLIHSALIVAPFSPPSWQELTRSYIMRVRPRFIALFSVDRQPLLAGTTRTTIEYVRSLPGIDSILQNHYTIVHRTRWHELFERKPFELQPIAQQPEVIR
jgi:hypothetical protein